MNLLDSLLDAIVRLDGDALVMHVGEKPYVVTTSEVASEFRGPLSWSQVELSSRVLTSEAVVGMLGQILPADQRAALDEYGAIEFEVAAPQDSGQRFTIIAARAGDDIWLEVRRHPIPEAEPVMVGVAESAAEGEAEQPIAIESPAVPEYVEHTAAQAETIEDEQAPTESFTSTVLPVQETAEGAVEEPVLLLDPDAVGPEQVLISTDQEWTDDVMTEQDLGELLRASAATVITGGAPVPVDHEPEFITIDEETLAEAALFSTAAAEPSVVLEDEEQYDIPLSPHEVASFERPRSLGVEPEADLPPKDPAVAAREALLAEQEAFWAAHAVPPITAGHPMVATHEETEPARAQSGSAETQVLSSAPQSEVTAVAAEAMRPTVPTTAVAEGPVAAEVRSESPRVEQTAAPELEAVAPSASKASVEDDEDVAPSRPAAVVLTLTRPTRPEAAASVRGGTATLERVLRLAAARGAATVYLVAQSAPMVRVDGEFSALDGEAELSGAVIERLTADLVPQGNDAAASHTEWVIDVPEIGRVRAMAFRDQRGPGLIFRMVPPRAISADQLGMPAEVQALSSEADGLVLVAGGRGSGKSTLLASFVDLINRTRSDHVITAESQIEFLHENKRSFISQREVRGDGDAVAAAVRAAVREDPDVLIVEDLRTPELVSLALEAAESGRLVFGSVPAASAVSAIERMIEMFPTERREKAQATLASALRGIVSQVLLRKLRGGRVAAREVLLNTPAVANLIHEGKTFQLPAALDSGRRYGMMPFAESLAALVREGAVHPSHAYRKAPNREQFLAILRRDGIDTSIAERFA